MVHGLRSREGRKEVVAREQKIDEQLEFGFGSARHKVDNPVEQVQVGGVFFG